MFPDDGTQQLLDGVRSACQCPATIAVTHYFDTKRVGLDCRQPFIFFAAEQKHWYETLRFPLDANCVRCPACRKWTQVLSRARRDHDTLAKVRPRAERDLEAARDWYEERRAGLGDEFLDEVAAGMRVLDVDPMRERSYYRDFRKILLRRFPYKIAVGKNCRALLVLRHRMFRRAQSI